MSASILLITAIVLFIFGYRFYGHFLSRKLGIDPSRTTPAHTKKDGVDYVPARSSVLVGHHFASIAGAGPILGPIYAVIFGWVPVFLWILIGSIFVGGVHDFTTLIASVRHGGKSIGEVIEDYIGLSGKRLFLIFSWFMLILIVAVFCRAVASIFVKEPATASSSFLIIILAVLFGLALYRFRIRLWMANILGVILLVGCIALGTQFPTHLSFPIWMAVLIVYIFIASVTPVWILLQPRDYLNSFLLYAILIGGAAGIFITNPQITAPMFTTFNTNSGMLFPILFVTVACGAISGFHSLVSSGTTSKQLNREQDAQVVGYGSMLIEGVLAVIALITALVLLQGDYAQLVTKEGGGPIGIFATGMGGFMSRLGIPKNMAVTFAALAISAFALTSLDTATRLGRFIFQEFFTREKSRQQPSLSQNRFIATFCTIAAASLLAFSGSSQSIWPLFGTANQLLAAIVLLTMTIWFSKLKRKNLFVKIPMVFMFAVTLTALGNLIYKNAVTQNWALLVIGILLMILAIFLIIQAVRSLNNSRMKEKG